MKSKLEQQLLDDGWTKKDIKYSAFGHTTRSGWSHPSKVFQRPVSFEKAYEFYKKYYSYNDWHYDNQGWN